MILKSIGSNSADAHKTVELVVLDHHGVELIGHKNVVPAHSRVVILDQSLNLIAGQVAPTVLGGANLSVA